ncbi:50S ribosomal protein L32e [Candidatus Thorarchaeota archaeon]|nr:MAG: 50S ribosomal protein L32e [Candidatus Thorarchaeota archaeon]
MSKKPELIDMPGLGPKLEEKLREAGIKTVLNLSRAKADKLAEKVDGLSESRAADLIALAQEMLQVTTTPKKDAVKKEVKPKAEKKTELEAKKPKTETAKKKAEPKAEKPKVEEPAKKKAKKAKAKEPKPKKKIVKEKQEVPVRFKNLDQRLVRIAQNKKNRMPNFHADQAHRWKRVSNRWRKLRGIDSYARQKKKGRIAMVSPGYRTPKAIRNLHPSLYIEVPVYRPADLEGLDADIHAVRISSTVGARKRQDILTAAEMKTLHVLNPGTVEEVAEEDLFTELDLEED